jgi:hypothetical protein
MVSCKLARKSKEEYKYEECNRGEKASATAIKSIGEREVRKVRFFARSRRSLLRRKRRNSDFSRKEKENERKRGKRKGTNIEKKNVLTAFS